MDRLKRDRAMLVAGGILIMLTQLSISTNCFSLFIVPICNDLGFMRGQFSVAQSMISMGGVVAAMFSGKIFNRFGIVRSMRVSAALAAVIYFMQSTVSTIPGFCIINFLLGFCNTFGTSVPLSLLITDWFSEKRNTITGIVMMGSGLGTSIFNSVANSLILGFGWRSAMKILTVIMAICSLGTDFLLLKEAPDSVKALGGGRPQAAAKGGKSSGDVPFFVGKHIPIAFMCAIISISSGIFMSTMQPHLQDVGYTQTYAAHLYSISMIFMAVGKIFHGMIIDRWGVRVSNTAIVVTASLGLFGLLHFSGAATAFLICIGMMFISSLNVVGAPALAEALGGAENKKFFLGKISACINVGYMLAPFIFGTVYDRVGSYVPMYYVGIGLLLVSLIGIWGLLPAKKEQKA
jgi:MFS family permease